MKPRTRSWPAVVCVTKNSVAMTTTANVPSTDAATSATSLRRLMREECACVNLEVRADRQGRHDAAEKVRGTWRREARRTLALLDLAVLVNRHGNRRRSRRRHADQWCAPEHVYWCREIRRAGQVRMGIVPEVELNGPDRREQLDAEARRDDEILDAEALHVPRARPHLAAVDERHVLEQIGQERIADAKLGVQHQDCTAADRDGSTLSSAGLERVDTGRVRQCIDGELVLVDEVHDRA